MFDIDHFKVINDTHGHSVGDQVLQTVAATFSATVRPGDILARFGGEEFVVVMRATGAHDAVVGAERLRRMIEETPIEVEGKSLRITVSAGVGTLDDCEGRSQEELFIAADDRLYEAKALGRNRVVGAVSEG